MSDDDGWRGHRGGACPVAPDHKVLVRYRNGVVSDRIDARERRWQSWGPELGDSDWDIVAWKPAGP